MVNARSTQISWGVLRVMSEQFVIRSRRHSADVADAARDLEDDVWGSLGYLNATQAHSMHYDRILSDFAQFQLCLFDRRTDDLVALANCVPLAWDGSPLPGTGWDWLVGEGMTERPAPANTLGALAISVPPRHRGAGHARRMIGEMKRLCREHGYGALIAPVRPSHKCEHPDVAMSDYVGWTDERGRPFDPWLRSHLSEGARVHGVCDRSMVVEQPVAFWETWAGRRFERSGSYALPGALVPLRIDLERDVGLYEEPNVWVVYDNDAPGAASRPAAGSPLAA